MTALETAEDEKALTAIAYLLTIVTPKVPAEVLQLRYSAVCKIITDRIVQHELSDSTALLKSLVGCLTTLLGAQPASVWAEGYTQKVFQMLLNFCIHPKPRVRLAVQQADSSSPDRRETRCPV
jgi:ribosomal RNA-processing protein 12